MLASRSFGIDRIAAPAALLFASGSAGSAGEVSRVSFPEQSKPVMHARLARVHGLAAERRHVEPQQIWTMSDDQIRSRHWRGRVVLFGSAGAAPAAHPLLVHGTYHDRVVFVR